MKKVLAWMIAIVMVLAGPAAAETTDPAATPTNNTTTTTTETSPGNTMDPATDPTNGLSGDEDEDQNDEDQEDENQKDDGDRNDSDQGNKKGHEKKERKYEQKYKGIERALVSLLKNLADGKGTPSDEALQAVIEKLKAMLKEDGTATTDDEAEQAVEEKLEVDVEEGNATEQDVEILVTIKIKGKKVDEAQTDLETALAQNPNSDKLYDLLSKVLMEKGDTQKVKVYVKGKRPVFDAEPYIKEGRTMVPVSAIAKALGAEVTWKGETKTVVIVKADKTIELPVGGSVIKVNGEAKTIDAAAEITSDRTMVPVKFVSEFLGQKVDWDPATRMVIVK